MMDRRALGGGGAGGARTASSSSSWRDTSEGRVSHGWLAGRVTSYRRDTPCLALTHMAGPCPPLLDLLLTTEAHTHTPTATAPTATTHAHLPASPPAIGGGAAQAGETQAPLSGHLPHTACQQGVLHRAVAGTHTHTHRYRGRGAKSNGVKGGGNRDNGYYG